MSHFHVSKCISQKNCVSHLHVWCLINFPRGISFSQIENGNFNFQFFKKKKTSKIENWKLIFDLKMKIKNWKLKTKFNFQFKLKFKNLLQQSRPQEKVDDGWKSFNVVEGSEKKSKNFGKKLDYFSIFNFKMKIENWRQNSIFKLKLNWFLKKLQFSIQF